jgi:hypothetical protein
LAVVGGLIVSQMLTLYITPVIYIGLEGLRSKWRHRRGVREAEVVPFEG